MTHQDREVGRERNENYNWENRVPEVASNAHWTAPTGYQHPNNSKTLIDPYTRKQNELESTVLPKEDYSAHRPILKPNQREDASHAYDFSY